jgi:hypothetical protein
MDPASPYQPPLPQGPPSFPGMHVTPPAVKVFGILHLVFAGLGVVGALWALFIAVVGNPFLKMAGANPQLGEQMEAQIAMQARINPASITSSALSLLVAIPMIVAGVLLLKERKNALKWSNAYAWSSLGSKTINLVLAVTIVVPAMQEMTRGILKTAPMPGAASDVMSMAMAGGAIGGVLVSCVYPILTLVILNRPATKEWFAGRPG